LLSVIAAPLRGVMTPRFVAKELSTVYSRAGHIQELIG
jgi:hypothetical protein